MMGGSHHRVAFRMVGKQPHRRPDGIWEYPPLGGAMREIVLEDMEVYISHQHNKAAQCITMWPILELCKEAKQRLGAQVSKRWL